MLLFTLSAHAAVRSGGLYEIQNETVSLGGAVSSGGVNGLYGHESSVGGFAGVSSVSGVVAAQGYIAQKTPLSGPEVVLGLPSGFSTVDMTLNGWLNPRGQATTAVFEYGTSPNDVSSASVTLSPDNGMAAQSVSVVLPGLVVGQAYYYRLSATNAEGTNHTDVGSFTVTITALAPIVTVQAASEVTSSSARLNGLMNPNGYAATASFEISPNAVNWTPLSAQPGTLNGTAASGVTAAATGLEPNTLYHCRLRGTNAAGSSTSASSITFTTAQDPPEVLTANPTVIASNGATLAGSVATENRPTTVYFEYGTSTAYGTRTPDQVIPAGGGVVPVSAPVSGLTTGVVYHFRMVGSNSGGTAAGSNVSFVPQVGITPTAPPTVTTSSAIVMSLDLVLVIGTVNPNGGPTTLRCEYGLTPALGSATTAQALGSTSVTQFALVELRHLSPGTLHYYRLSAENSLGVTHGTTLMFMTPFPPPEAATGISTPQTSTSVMVTGTVRARNASTNVFFDYGTDGVSFPNSVSASPATLSNDVSTSVSATLPNLRQDTDYFYRVRATSSGGTTTGLTATFKVSLLSGLQRQFPSPPPGSGGQITVHLTPAASFTGWRVKGERAWRASGSTASGFTMGEREIEFHPAPGYIHPGNEIVTVNSSGPPVELTGEYFTSAVGGSGSLQVFLKPLSITTGVDRAQWRRLGESVWHESGEVDSGLAAGSYLIECKPVPGRTTPPNMSVDIADGQNAPVLIAYAPVTEPVGASPLPLSFANVSADTAMPHAFVGQIRSRAGVGSGFVVRPRVVATAAHVLWDDVTLSNAQDIEWLFQKHAEVHEPEPIIPRGHYLITGYAAQRQDEGTPGASSPASQTLDAATLYFAETAGRDGHSGYLASDLPDNSTEHLLASRDKSLIGYPFDGIAPEFQGIMHATPAANIAFTHAYDRTYSTTGVHGVGGMSGGPLCVLHTNGNWYPAAIYLGGNAQTVVRVIDSLVIELINGAAISAGGGANNTSGGITQTSITRSASTTVGTLTIHIDPVGAVNAGAGWRLAPESLYRRTGTTKGNLISGTYILEFPTVSGYDAPTQQSVAITAGEAKTLTFRYNSPQESWRRSFFGSVDNSGSGADDFDYDGDGFTNAQEYAAGTNPIQSSDFFKATDSQRSGNTFSLSTAGKAGRIYHLERSTNLTTWLEVTSNGPLSVEGPVILSDTDSNGSAFFYRIRVTGP